MISLSSILLLFLQIIFIFLSNSLSIPKIIYFFNFHFYLFLRLHRYPICAYIAKIVIIISMVLILDGNSEIGAHV